MIDITGRQFMAALFAVLGIMLLTDCGSTQQLQKVTIVYRGTTAIGRQFTVVIRQPALRPISSVNDVLQESNSSSGCASLLEVVEGGSHYVGRGSKGIDGGDGGLCIDGEPSYEPSVDCGHKTLIIEITTTPGVDEVTLTRERGSAITSGVADVSSRFGVSQGFYYQVVPLSPLPVSVAELTEGRLVKLVILPRVTWCA